MKLSTKLSFAVSGLALVTAALTGSPAGANPPRPTEVQVRAHVIAPPHTVGIHTDVGLTPAEAAQIRSTRPIVTGPVTPHLDVNKFGPALHVALKDSVAGYVMQLRQHGHPISTLIWNWAQTPSDSPEGWGLDVHQHVASVSKLMTAMGMTRTLDDHHISYDAKIIDYLPTYWAKGAHIDQITFRNLMTQTSGFNTGGSYSDFHVMKNMVAQGTNTVGQYHYENMNFGICRILMAVIDGFIAKNESFGLPGLNDSFWDMVTLDGYQVAMQQKVFGPAGVGGATLDHPANDALAYNFPVNGHGWNSGNLASDAGGAGWHMSVNELLAVMGTFRRADTIVSHPQQMMDNGFGLDVVAQQTPAGPLYNKNGAWGDGAGHEEQALAYFLPDDMELVVLTNSPVGAPGQFFRGVVTNVILANIH